jgi:hypothetical protein
MSNIIKLSLCGKKFEVAKEVLERSPYFKDIFEEYEKDSKTFERLYVPRSPLAFEHILTYLICDKYEVPSSFDEDMRYFLLKEPLPLKVENKFEYVEYTAIDGEIIKVCTSDEVCLKFGFKCGEVLMITAKGPEYGKIFKVVGVYEESLFFLEKGKESKIFRLPYKTPSAILKVVDPKEFDN